MKHNLTQRTTRFQTQNKQNWKSILIKLINRSRTRKHLKVLPIVPNISENGEQKWCKNCELLFSSGRLQPFPWLREIGQCMTNDISIELQSKLPRTAQ